MDTEITDTTNLRGWVLFDGDCAVCIRLAQRFAPGLRRQGFALAPLQSPWVKARLALPPDVLLSEMRLLTRGGDVYGGADALVALAGYIGWARPLGWLAGLPSSRAVLRKVYAWVARLRHCHQAGCALGAGATGSAAGRLPGSDPRPGTGGGAHTQPRRRRRVFFEMP